MADLWKDGDVITAEKLNRFVLTRATMTEENNQITVTLDITPNDIFGADNNLNSFVVIDGQNNTETMITSSFMFGYSSQYNTESGSYRLGVSNIIDSDTIYFDASSRTDYFVAVLDNNN